MTETVLGQRYRLDELIGRGGMASVWRATDTVLDRPVAVKRLHAGLLDDEELAARFGREARLVARLSHPNLVHLLDRGDDEAGPYLVLELVEGEDLKARVRRDGALAPEEAARICAQVARALAYAHAQGIVHRDIKAQNVLLTRAGDAKLADFGIARLMEPGMEAGVTRTDVIIGSADYLAPEQADGRAVDARTDVYSLGIVLYECLTGQLPFRGEGFVAMAMRHVNDPMPDPRRVQPGVPASLAAIAERAGAKAPDDRFASAADLANSLEAASSAGGTAVFAVPPGLREPPADEVTGRSRRVRRKRLALLGTGLAALLAAGGVSAALLLGGDDGAGPSSPAPQPGLVAVAATVDDFDPEGGDGERHDLIPLASDGRPDTSWETEKYSTEAFGNLKSGVGIILSPVPPHAATELDLDSTTPGVGYQVLGPMGADGRPTLAEGTFRRGAQAIPLRDVGPQSEYVLWLTKLAPNPEGDGRFVAYVGEVSLRGPANP